MRILFIISLFIFQINAHAAPMESFEFDTVEQEKIFKKLSDELRCLVCQNQSIAESNAGLAKDLRKELHGMLQAGKTEAQIKEFMVSRYGDYVLYQPPMKPMTWVLWFGPALIFLVGLYYARKFVFQQNAVKDSGELSAEEAERLRNLQTELNNTKDKSEMKQGDQ